jgi:hypothetical protein
MSRPLLTILLLLLAAACAGRGRAARVTAELGEVPARAARICVLRPSTLARDVTMEVRDNGRLVGATRGASYFCYLAEPGEHQLASIDDDTGPTLLAARAGGLYWIHQEVVELGGATHAHLDGVDEATASELLEDCEARVLVAVPGHDDEAQALPLVRAATK